MLEAQQDAKLETQQEAKQEANKEALGGKARRAACSRAMKHIINEMLLLSKN